MNTSGRKRRLKKLTSKENGKKATGQSSLYFLIEQVAWKLIAKCSVHSHIYTVTTPHKEQILIIVGVFLGRLTFTLFSTYLKRGGGFSLARLYIILYNYMLYAPFYTGFFKSKWAGICKTPYLNKPICKWKKTCCNFIHWITDRICFQIKFKWSNSHQ